MENIEKARSENGTFLPGNDGRPKGAKNKLTQEKKEKIEWVLSTLEVNLEEDILAMNPTEMVKLWLDLQEYINPKLQRVSLDAVPEDNKITKITFEVVPAGRPSV
jgi:hypothetical protein